MTCATSTASQLTKFNFRCVAFDLDDTLWSMVETIHAAHNAMADRMVVICPSMATKYGSTAAFRELSDLVKQEHPSKASDFTFVRKEALRIACDEFKVDNCNSAVDACFDAFFIQRNKPSFFHGAVDTLKELRQRGFRLGAVTDGNADVFSIPELDGMFEFAVTAGQVGVAKPDPRIFERALELASVHPSEMLYVGDNFGKDVQGPAALGIQSVWVHNPNLLLNPLFKEYHWGAHPVIPENPHDVAVAVIQAVPELLEMLHAPNVTSSSSVPKDGM